MLNREIVSFRSCVRTRGLVVRWELEKIELPVTFPFSLLPFQDGISLEFWCAGSIGRDHCFLIEGHI